MKIFGLLFAFTVIAFELSPRAYAILPAPDGGYPNGNTAEGQNALFSLTTGAFNTAVGFLSLRGDIGGSFNTALGAGALLANTSDNNTATGAAALLSNNGAFNTANGALALLNNTNGYENTATGYSALTTNLDGVDNTANGINALYRNDHGNNNTAIGASALYNNQGGYNNTAVGVQASFGNTAGLGNTAVGKAALWANTTGGENTAIGGGALGANQIGNENTAIGTNALGGNSSGSANIALGADAGYNLTGSHNIAIGNAGESGENDTVRIGDSQTKSYIAGIYGVTTNGAAIPIVIDGSGQLGTISSSRRFKKDIATIEKASEAILSLRPVRFRYKTDTNEIAQFGLIAEEVAKVNPALVVPDKEGKPFTVRYDAVNAMLLNEFLKEHKTVEELMSIVAKQEAIAAQQQKQIETLTAGLQKVSAQLELSKVASQTVLNNE